MKILTAAEMGAADRRTADEFAVSFSSLMQAAGTSVARFVMANFPAAHSVLALCGTGNNGGDGFVAARVLHENGLGVEVVVLGTEERIKGDAAAAFRALESANLPIQFINAEDEIAVLASALQHAHLVLDAVVGTGFQPPLRGVAVHARDLLAASTVTVVAVDLPSGWDADAMTETVEGAFRATAVVTFTAPKLAHMFGHLTKPDVFGPVVVAPIGSPEQAIQSDTNLNWTGTAKHIFDAPRPIDSNKGMYGHVMVIGGAFGKPGAPSMASLAALRFGAGLVTAAVPRSILNTVARVTPELMTQPLAEDANGVISMANAQHLDKLLKNIDVLAVGPGLGTEGGVPEYVHTLLRETKLPLVLDADALNALAGRTNLLDGRNRTIVLTPHPGEMGRLLGISTKQVQADRLNVARRFATQHAVTLVLKGWRTLVAHPDGEVSVNTTGNPSMAKGGSGDILTGIVAAALGQFPQDVTQAVNAAVYMHGLAGDFAAHAQDEHTVLATDTVAHLADAFRYRTQDSNHAEWICGLRQHGRKAQ